MTGKADAVLTTKVAHRFLKDPQSISLAECDVLDADAAAILASSREDLCLDALKEISPVAAQALTSHVGAISLQSLERLTLPAAQFLSLHVGPLRDLTLGAFVDDPAVFAALRRHPSLASQVIEDDFLLIQLLKAKDIDTEDSKVFECADASSKELIDEEYCGNPVEDGLRLFKKAEGQPVWKVQLESVQSEWKFEGLGAYALYFVGERDDVLRRIDLLPNRLATARVVKKYLKECDSGDCPPLESYGAIDVAAAALLATDFPWGEWNELDLSGVRNLSPEVAASLSKTLPQDEAGDKVPGLVLRSCRELPKETAQALSSRKWRLRLPHLRTVSSEAAEYLARVRFLFVGVEELSADAAACLTSCQDLGLRIPRLEAGVASSLSKTAGTLCLELRHELDADAATALGTRRGKLAFVNLPSLSAVAARGLAGHKGSLDLGYCDLTAEVAQILCNHEDELIVSKPQPPDVASILKQHPSFK